MAAEAEAGVGVVCSVVIGVVSSGIGFPSCHAMHAAGALATDSAEPAWRLAAGLAPSGGGGEGVWRVAAGLAPSRGDGSCDHSQSGAGASRRWPRSRA